MTRGLQLAGVLLTLLLAIGCKSTSKPEEQQQQPQPDAAAPDAEAPPEPTPGQPFLLFATDLDAALGGSYQEQFPLQEQRDVVAVAGVPDAGGARVLRLDLKSPGGGLHTSLYRAFASEDGAPSSVPHPVSGLALPVQKATVQAGLAQVMVTIPVAGTNLTRFNLTGVYTGEVYVELETTPTSVGTFELVGAP